MVEEQLRDAGAQVECGAEVAEGLAEGVEVEGFRRWGCDCDRDCDGGDGGWVRGGRVCGGDDGGWRIIEIQEICTILVFPRRRPEVRRRCCRELFWSGDDGGLSSFAAGASDSWVPLACCVCC